MGSAVGEWRGGTVPDSRSNQSRDERVLVIDDDPVQTLGIGRLLRNAGYEVTTLPSGDTPEFGEALNHADLVILDVEIPGARDGFEVLAAIRASESSASLPVLMLTAHDPVEYRIRGLEVGADDYMSKPPNERELVLRVGALLRRSTHRSTDEPRLAVAGLNRDRVLIPLGEVVRVEAKGNFCVVFAGERRYTADRGIGDIEQSLGEHLVRTHRSHLVNPAHVTALRRRSEWSYEAVLDGNEDVAIPISASYVKSVREAVGL